MAVAVGVKKNCGVIALMLEGAVIAIIYAW